MGNDNKKGELRGKKFVWFERMLRREGRKLCAVALCASIIVGNMVWPVAAASDTSGEYSFELASESLFYAIQDAIAEGTVVDTELELKGSAADEYQSFLEAGSNLYEIVPVIENGDSDRDKVLDLRAFVRVSSDIELDSAYVMDGSEEITFLLVNSSEVYQQATISVDGRESEMITVLPKGAVAVDEKEAELGVSGTVNHSNTTMTGSGGSGGGGGGRNNDTGTDTADVRRSEELDTADIFIQTEKIDGGDMETGSAVEVETRKDSDDNTQESEKGEDSTEEQQGSTDSEGEAEDRATIDVETENASSKEADSDPDEISDSAVDDSTSNGENTDGDTTEGEPGDSAEKTGDSENSDETNDGGAGSEEEAGEADADESGDNNTTNDQGTDSEKEADDEEGSNDERKSYVSAASVISAHITNLVAASATSADAKAATSSDASHGLNGETYETILVESEASAAYVTTAEELSLDKIESVLYTTELDDVVFGVEAPVGALPWGVELKASEYEKDSEIYQSRYAETVDMIDALNKEEDHTEAIRLFDVGFYDTDGVEVEPTEKVNVIITYLEVDADDVGQVVHFGEEETEVIDVEINYDEDGNKNITYELESFSLIATVSGGDNGITNVMNDEKVKPPTGIFTEYLPYALMVMTALLGGAWLVNGRRKKIYADREQ